GRGGAVGLLDEVDERAAGGAPGSCPRDAHAGRPVARGATGSAGAALARRGLPGGASAGAAGPLRRPRPRGTADADEAAAPPQRPSVELHGRRMSGVRHPDGVVAGPSVGSRPGSPPGSGRRRAGDTLAPLSTRPKKPAETSPLVEAASAFDETLRRFGALVES